MRKLDWVSPLPPGLPFTLTVAEAAEWLRISKGGVYELVHRGIATNGVEGLPIVKLGLDRTWRIPTIAVLRLVGVVDPPPEPWPQSGCAASLPVVIMGSRDARPDGRSTLPGSQLVLDGRIVDSVESLRPMAWVVLEAVALAAAVEDQALVAHTSARQVAQLLGLDPGTAAAALRLLRKRGLLELRRTGGEAGRFGLSAYVLGDIAALGIRPCVTPPGVVAPHAADPHTEPRSGEPANTPPTSCQPARGSRRSAYRPSGQGAFDLYPGG